MAMGPKVVVPVATYLFHRIDQRLDGRPTLIILDEAWIMLTNSVFGAKIEEWLRTLRKKNAAVVLATQSLKRNRQFSASRRNSGVLSDQALPA